MEENLKVDEEYLNGFNLGYELAKELQLTSPMLNDINQDNTQMQAMHAGMAEFCNEIEQAKQKELDLNSNGIKSKNDKDKGFNISI